jgi:biotin carboxyl carrier protein
MDVLAEWPGRVAEIHVGIGDHVTPEQELVTIESMKMLMPVTASGTGEVVSVAVQVDQYVDAGALLLQLSG